ncbi:MAG TPA: hypothetical protein VNZ22_08875, partial [Bacillota bacterium]|nr:hypothetical protein [Bacillota bacterium]
MKSHDYQFTSRELCRLLLPTLLALACLAGGLKLSQRLGLLPRPPISLDPDTTVMAHQSAVCRAPSSAQVIILGDSTALVGVEARELARHLPGQPGVLNLSLFIWLDLSVYGEVLADYAAAHPGQVRAVVVLLSPNKLTGQDQNEAANEGWRQIHHDAPRPPSESEAWKDWLGVSVWQRQLLGQLLRTPLHGDGAAFFGFSSEIETYMTEHQGSLVDFGTLKVPRNISRTERQLAPRLEEQSRGLRARVPAGARLFIGLTPMAAGASSATERRQRNEWLAQWNNWMQADGVLTNLPVTLPDVFFSRTAHLN